MGTELHHKMNFDASYHDIEASLVGNADLEKFKMPIDQVLAGYAFQHHGQGAGLDPQTINTNPKLLDTASSSNLGPIHGFSNAFEDGYSEIFSGYDPGATAEQNAPADAETTPALERGSTYLHFSSLTYGFELLDYTYRGATVSLAAQLNGMFFLAPSHSPSGDTGSTGAVAAVACYRRNLFSVTGSVVVPRALRYVSTDQNDQIPIVSLELGIFAMESLECAPVKLISVPIKSAIVAGADERADREPGTISLDMMAGAEVDPEYGTFPIEWKRLQFRTSTANNGRRKELQQHFSLYIKLLATLKTGQRISVCEASTSPVVVRGRSPRNFQPKKETNAATTGSISGTRLKANEPEVEGQTRALALSDTGYNFDHSDFNPPNYWDWNAAQGSHQGAMAAYAGESFQAGSNDFVARSSPDLSLYHLQTSPPLPISLSLLDEEPKQMHISEPGPLKKARNFSHNLHRPPVPFSRGSLSSGENNDCVDGLYEYFPLGLDDWQEPVEAIYRPHVVHHINTPSDPKAMTFRNKSKRYFSEDSAS